MIEQTALFGKSSTLVGIVTESSPGSSAAAKPAVILLNAGIIHRVGPNRIAVRIARRLASLGHLTLRFDHSGIGDSLRDSVPLPQAERLINETQAAMDYLEEKFRVKRFILMGLCSGAITAFQTAGRDERVVGVALLNAMGMNFDIDWIRSVESQWSHRLEMARIKEQVGSVTGAWKTLTNKTELFKALRATRNHYRDLLHQDRSLGSVAAGLAEEVTILLSRQVRLLWLFSEEDSSIAYFKLITEAGGCKLSANTLLTRVHIFDTNHTLDTIASQEQAIGAVTEWAGRYFG